MSTFYKANVTATNGSAFVEVNSSGDDVDIIRERSLLQIGDSQIVEVKRPIPGTPDQIELAEAWADTTVTADAIAAPTAGDLVEAVQQIRTLTQQGETVLADALLKSGNLVGLTDAAAARDNLGISAANTPYSGSASGSDVKAALDGLHNELPRTANTFIRRNGANDAFEAKTPQEVASEVSPLLLAGPYMTYGGTADAITLTSNNQNAVGTLKTGMQFRFRATATNTGATTIAVDGGSPIDCVTVTGVALPAGYIRTDVDTVGTFDGTDFVVDRQIERGSNSNGEFVRFADGSAWFSIIGFELMTFGGGYSADWDFPANFSNDGYFASIILPNSSSAWDTPNDRDNAGIVAYYAEFTASVGLAVRASSPSGNIRDVRAYAAGDWY